MRVVLAEDSVLLREGLVRLLAEAGAEVVAAVADGPSLVKAVHASVNMQPRLKKLGFTWFGASRADTKCVP